MDIQEFSQEEKIQLLQQLLNDENCFQLLQQKLNSSISIWGDKSRLFVGNGACMVNSSFNTSSGNITIGENTFTGHNVCFLTGTHDVSKINMDRIKGYPLEGRDIIVGKGVWIASNATILGPCNIGDYAVIAAGAVVTAHTIVPPYTIYAGIPARMIRKLEEKLSLEDNNVKEGYSAKAILEKIKNNDSVYIINSNPELTKVVNESIESIDWEEVKGKNKSQIQEPLLSAKTIEAQNFQSSLEKVNLPKYTGDLTWYYIYSDSLNENKDITKKIPPNTRFRFIKRVINRVMKVCTSYQEIFNNAIYGVINNLMNKTVDNEKTIYQSINKINEVCDKIDQLESLMKQETQINARQLNDVINKFEQFDSLMKQEIQKNTRQFNDVNIKFEQLENQLMQEIKIAVEQTNGELELIDQNINQQIMDISNKVKSCENNNEKIVMNEEWLRLLNDRVQADENWIDLLAKTVEKQDHAMSSIRSELLAEIKMNSTNNSKNVTKNTETKILPSYEAYLKRSKGLKKVNIGCGVFTFEDYINIDCRELENVDIVADVMELPFTENELDEIFASHLLEHFELDNLENKLLPYWKSLLRDNGILRVKVPDIGSMITQYQNGEYDFTQLREIIFGGQEYSGNYHYTMFNEEELIKLLKKVGFTNIKVLAKGRKNGLCLELDVVASK